MGSKRLKAVVLEGTKPIASTDPEAIKRLSWKCSRKIRALPAPKGKYLAILGRLLSKLKFAPAMNGKLIATMWRRWGTSSMNQFSVELGDSPIKNWKGSSIDYPGHVSRNIDPDRIIAREKEKYHCYSCPLGCGGRCSMKHDKWKETHKPEYETIMSFGGLLLNADLDSIFYLNELLNRAGMDTISAGGTIAFAQECFEKRFITTDDTGGIDLSWGNTEGIIALVEKMVNREGIGDLLADGSRKAAEKIGQGSKDFAITAGGQELAMHDPRNDPGFGLHAGADPTPGKHSIGAQQYYELQALWKRVKTLPRVKPLISIKCKFIADKEKAVHAVANSCFSQFYNGAGLCLFAALLGVHRVPIFEWMNAATGWNRTPGEYIEVGRRIQTLKQLFNIKHGIDPLSLKPSPRSVGDPPLTQGPNKERSFDLDKMLRDYWQEIGWDRNSGNPTAETVDALGLKDIISGEKIDFTTTAIKSRMVRKSEKPPKGTKPTVNKKICVSCSTCIQACPVSCLIFRRGSGRDPHPYPELPNPKNCISCGICKQNCPVNAIVMKA
jgi:aldehyde:ferredoxin oxidoreductase